MTDERREEIGQVLQMAREGLPYGDIGAKIGRSKSFVAKVVSNLPRLIRAMEAQSA